ncbi:MAG: signal transduction histidine kinase [Candidatus Azotimanducaceae bacterium]|jgi:signal transduction histidine kinase
MMSEPSRYEDSSKRSRNGGAASVRLLFLVPVILLFAIPIAGYFNIETASQAMLAAEIKNQRASIKTLKSIIEADASLLNDFTYLRDEAAPLYVHPRQSEVNLDGQTDEWLLIEPDVFAKSQLVQLNFPFDDNSLSATLRLQQDDQQIYLMLTVKDDHVVYREISNISIHRNDHLRLAMTDKAGNFQRYTVATEQPGQVFGRIVSTGGRSLRPEPRIQGFWRATGDGYHIELAIDNDLVDDRFGFGIADVDDSISRDIKYMLGNTYTDSADELGYLIHQSTSLTALLQRHNLIGASIVDRYDNLIAITDTAPSSSMTIGEKVFIEDEWVATIALGINVSAIETYKKMALEQLVVISAATIAFGLLLCFWLSGQLLARLKRMGLALEGVVDDQGRVLKVLPDAVGQDEISELSRRFSSVTRRLHQYNEYLENLSGRLAHELRTPVSVVRSSLEQLETRIEGDDIRYVERAKNGVARLTNILNSMSEAARLEESLDKNEVTVFELTQVLKGCFEGYDHAFADQQFELSIETDELKVTGIADLFAQMLDKLVDNAVQFSSATQPVILRLTCEDDMAVLRISNSGPALPATMADQLFDPMISVRSNDQREDSHLGLGLHVARLITEFHGGTITLSNREDREGAVVTVRLPLLRLTSKLI